LKTKSRLYFERDYYHPTVIIDGQPRAVSFSRCRVLGMAGRTAYPENGEAITLKLLDGLIKESQHFALGEA